MAARLLLLDTTLNGLSLALGEMNDQGSLELRVRITSPEKSLSSEKLPSTIAEALVSLQWSASDLQGIIVANGPGSFTGIRVGLSFIDGLLHGSHDKLLTLQCSSIIALALALKNRDCASPVLTVILPSTRSHAFVMTMAADDLNLAKLTWVATLSQSVDTLAGTIKLIEIEAAKGCLRPQQAVYLIDSPWADWSLKLQEWQIPATVLTSIEAVELVIDGMKALAEATWPQAFSRQTPKPIYLRASTVEEKAAALANANKPVHS